MSRLQGRVKWFDSRKGFGFITNLDDERELFVHHSRLVTEVNCFKTLYEGEYVLFDIVTDNKKELANNIKGIREGPLLCECRISRNGQSHSSQTDQSPTDQSPNDQSPNDS